MAIIADTFVLKATASSVNSGSVKLYALPFFEKLFCKSKKAELGMWAFLYSDESANYIIRLGRMVVCIV